MKNYTRMNRVFLLLIIVYVGGSWLIGAVAPFLADTTFKASIITEILLLLVPTAYCIRHNIDVPRKYMIRPVNLSTVLISMLFVALCYPLVTIANLASQLFASNEASALIDYMMGPNMAVNVLIMAILPGIVEELIFRGMFYNEYKEGGMICGAVLSSVLFGLLHLNFNQFSYAIILGFVFALIAEATGSIITTMLCHMTLNGMNVLLVSLYSSLGISVSDVEISSNEIVLALGAWSVIAAIATVGAVGVFMWLCKHTGRAAHMKQFMHIEHGRKITVSLVLSVILCVAYMVIFNN